MAKRNRSRAVKTAQRKIRKIKYSLNMHVLDQRKVMINQRETPAKDKNKWQLSGFTESGKRSKVDIDLGS